MSDPNWIPTGTFGSSGFETEWLTVNTARQGGVGSAEALEKICRTYWYPLYAYVRGKGFDVHAAQDLTQEFFSRLLAKPWLQDVHASKGKFRAFLLAAMNNFLMNEWRKEKTQKRGGGREIFSMDALEAEQRYKLEPFHNESPDQIFERNWALTVLERAKARMRDEYATFGQAELFDKLLPTLNGEKSDETYAQIGIALNMTETAVKKSAQRMREHYDQVVREEVSTTVNGPEALEEETKFLHAALRF